MNDTTFSRKRPGYKLSISQEQSVKNDLQLELVGLLNISARLKFLLPRALQLLLFYSPNEEKPTDSLGHRSCPRSGHLCQCLGQWSNCVHKHRKLELQIGKQCFFFRDHNMWYISNVFLSTNPIFTVWQQTDINILGASSYTSGNHHTVCLRLAFFSDARSLHCSQPHQNLPDTQGE